MISGLGALDPTAAGTTQSLFPQRQADEPAGMGQTFGTMLSEAAGQTVAKLDRAEQNSMQALQGDADTREVVDAVMSAEQSLQAAIAIRDKIVTAYLEMSRMSI